MNHLNRNPPTFNGQSPRKRLSMEFRRKKPENNLTNVKTLFKRVKFIGVSSKPL